MKLNDLRPAHGAITPAWRRGQGPGSGNGKTAGRGSKGQHSRSGGSHRRGFEAVSNGFDEEPSARAGRSTVR